MSQADFPPGCDGMEYEVVGPHEEWHELLWCHVCEATVSHHIQLYATDRWAHCDCCGTEREAPAE